MKDTCRVSTFKTVFAIIFLFLFESNKVNTEYISEKRGEALVILKLKKALDVIRNRT